MVGVVASVILVISERGVCSGERRERQPLKHVLDRYDIDSLWQTNCPTFEAPDASRGFLLARQLLSEISLILECVQLLQIRSAKC